MKLDHRIVVLKALVGSHNYNLNAESSDKDYKYFVLSALESECQFLGSLVQPRINVFWRSWQAERFSVRKSSRALQDESPLSL